MTEPIQDPKAVEAFMREHGFVLHGLHDDLWFHPQNGAVTPLAAIFFYQALQSQKDALYEAVMAKRPAKAEYPTGDEIVADGINMATAIPFDDGYNEALNSYDAEIAAVFGKDKP